MNAFAVSAKQAEKLIRKGASDPQYAFYLTLARA